MKKLISISRVFVLLLAISCVHCKTADEDSDLVDLSLTFVEKPSVVSTKTESIDVGSDISPPKPLLGVIAYLKARIRNCLKRKLKFIERIPEWI